MKNETKKILLLEDLKMDCTQITHKYVPQLRELVEENTKECKNFIKFRELFEKTINFSFEQGKLNKTLQLAALEKEQNNE